MLQFPFGGLRSGAGKCPVCLVDAAVAEGFVHPFQTLAGLGEKCDAADGAVEAVGNSHKDVARLAVALRDETLQRLAERLVSCLVALDYFADFLVYYKHVVVLIEDAGGDVFVHFQREFFVNHNCTCH